MRRTKTAVLPSVDVMEPRLLLSTAAPLLSKHALTGVVREIRAIVSTLAKTGDTAQASAQLAGLSSQIPSGPAGLAQSWQSDIGLYRPHSARSIVSMETRIVGDLDRYNRGVVDGGNRPVSGSGSTTSTTPNQGTGGTATPVPMPKSGQGTAGTSTPAPLPSLDSVRIQNTTGLALQVTVHLEVPQNHQPSITETIPAQGSSIASFDFGTATNVFMTMDVSRADGGGQSPPPWTNINLSQPLSGYNGVLFTISLFGSYFSVNVP
ncbi:MAG TPA: hypothetical protein VHS97_24385 [Isosphaeraceae bacterium]|nr:hypothetical protein [Isosphaeraceae bacterium]